VRQPRDDAARPAQRAAPSDRQRLRSGRASAPLRGKRLPRDVNASVSGNAPETKAARYRERLAEAAKAYERDRYRDALKLLKPLAEALPGASPVRELYGLTLYRLARWNDAIRELEAFRALEPADYDQHPTLADSYRAKKRWRDVERVWDELREASPSADLVAEGRIVMAGSLADQGKLTDAIALLEKARTDTKRPRPHHLRLWYATADLYEKAGETPRARELFRRVFAADPELYDTSDRLRAIG
jgi:tetratricopeptide (TPR) repeat protein